MILALALAGGAVRARAGTINTAWNGGTGNWNVATDWTPNGVPNNGGGNAYNVTTDSGGTDLVSLNINATIASLVLGGTTGGSTLQNLASTAETLAVTGATTINSTGTLEFANASTLKFEGGLTSGGSFYLTGATGTITGTGTFNSGSGTFISGGSTLTLNGNLTNNSTSFYTGYSSGGNTLTVTGGFTNNGSLYMYGNIGGGGGDTLNVTGTLTTGAGGGPDPC